MNPKTVETLPFFKGLAPDQMDLLVAQSTHDSYPKDTVIFSQGDRAEMLYILIEGRVEIRFKPEDGELLTVGEIKEGGVFGWSAALGRRIYTSCAVCLVDSRAVSLRGEVLQRIYHDSPETGVVILERLAEVIAQRLQNTHAHVVEMLQRGMSSTE